MYSTADKTSYFAQSLLEGIDTTNRIAVAYKDGDVYS